MITLITGTPGAGKTLYAISKLLRELVGSTVKKTEADGSITEVPRRILTNINGLLIDHELIGPDVGGGLADWHTWAKPGDVICYDEVQKSWPPRANGSKVPDYIQGLETHRHMGVDFIILTQNPMLIDRNVTALVGRHLHVRRFGGMGAATVYEWDHCSRSLLFSKSISKAPFMYDKAVFKLYKSAELHTKPKTSIPTLAIVVVLALVGAAFFIPYAMDRVMRHSDEKQGLLSKTANPAGSASSPPASVATGERPAIAATITAKGQTVYPPLPYGLDQIKLIGMMIVDAHQSYFFESPDGLKLTSDEMAKVGYRFSKADGCAVQVETDKELRHYLCERRDKNIEIINPSIVGNPGDTAQSS